MENLSKDSQIVSHRLREPKVSYYLLGKKIFFILNSNARSGNVAEIIRKISRGFPLYSFNVILSSATKVASELTRDVLSKDSLFIVMGGDGTINSAVQYLIHTPATFGVIPKGTANDLANVFGIPQNMERALDIIAQGNIAHLDTMRVNANHILTIGSIGFPATVADRVNEFKAGHSWAKFLHRYVLRSSIYKVFALLVALKGREKACRHFGQVEVDGRRVHEGAFVAVFFGKQEILGKGFRPCPGVKPSDPFMKVSILKYAGVWSLLKDMYWLGRGQPERSKNLVSWEAQSFRIRTNEFVSLLGDGEILDADDEFIGNRVDRCLRFIVPQAWEGRTR